MDLNVLHGRICGPGPRRDFADDPIYLTLVNEMFRGERSGKERCQVFCPSIDFLSMNEMRRNDDDAPDAARSPLKFSKNRSVIC
jgi:hypothetical protein